MTFKNLFAINSKISLNIFVFTPFPLFTTNSNYNTFLAHTANINNQRDENIKILIMEKHSDVTDVQKVTCLSWLWFVTRLSLLNLHKQKLNLRV
jgi:hypothetical protein